MSNPAVSILVPVYNSGEYLRRFLESVVVQTLEDIEVILINNQSTDNSLEIMEEFSQSYPDKFFVHTIENHYEYVGVGRNEALKYARGEYVYFCDSDDMVNCKALEVMYETAKQHNADIVCGYAKFVRTDEDGNCSITNVLYKKNCDATIEMAIISGAEFWVRLIRKDLIERVGSIPEDVLFDDIAYVPVLQSYAKQIKFVEFPVYYYFRRENSTVGTPSIEVALDSVKAERYILANCNKDYIKAVENLVARRISGNLNTRWQFYDIFVDFLKELWARFEENELIKDDKRLYNRLKNFIKLCDKSVPNNVFINGFSSNVDNVFLETIQQKAFNEGCNIYVLDENNCDVTENKVIENAYLAENYDFVGKYFAIKKIYEHGGVFISKKVKIINSFNFLKYQGAFVSMLDQSNYSDEVFGSYEKNAFYEKLLHTYNWDFSGDKTVTLAERMKMVLTLEYDYPLDGKVRWFGNPVSLLPPSLMVANLGLNSRSICEYQYFDIDDKDAITLKRQTLKYLVNEYVDQNIARVTAENAQLKKDLDQRNKSISDYKGMVARRDKSITDYKGMVARRDKLIADYKKTGIDDLMSKHQKALDELDWIKTSDSWKFTLKLKGFANSWVGFIPKKIFKFVVRVYRKMKE